MDTETTGLYPGSICQLSYIMQTKENTVAKNFFFSVDYVESGAYMVHGFSVPILRELSNGKRFADFIDEIEQDFLSAEVIIAHNTAFDFSFLRTEFERLNREFVPKREFCSMKKSISILKILRSNGGYKYPKLSELCEYFCIPNWTIENKCEKLFGEMKGFHDARFDTTALYLAVNEGMKCEENFQVLKNCL
ncbi:MAG: 3'-5' exonuclease [Clostridia bacterium]|nr:3'-5' exonuclease [Clostridia bacterium]